MTAIRFGYKLRALVFAKDKCRGSKPFPSPHPTGVESRATLLHPPRYLCEVFTLLRPGGTFLLLSFHPLTFLQSVLASPALPFVECTATVITKKAAGRGMEGGMNKFSLLALQRPGVTEPSSAGTETGPRTQAVPDLGALQRHMDARVDEEKVMRNPLLTDQARKAIQDAFVAAAEQLHGTRVGRSRPETDSEPTLPALPLSLAYDCMFDEELKSGYAYDDFMSDWESFCVDHPDLNDADTCSLEQALCFLQTMQ